MEPAPERVLGRVDQVLVDGHRLEYTDYGSASRGGGDRWVVLVHGLLMPRTMHEPLARKLAAAGNHVIAVDLLGHGRSDKPADPRLYSISEFARQVVALLDARGIERAVVGGTSLGANVALEVGVIAPDRVQGLLVEMPVLDNAVEAAILAFSPLLLVSRFLPFAVSAVRWTSGLVPRKPVGLWGRVLLETLDQRAEPMAALVHGMFFGHAAPSSAQRAAIEAPALVVGHPRDPVHPTADSQMLAAEMPHARFVPADSILEWRFRPDRLDGEAIAFVADCYGGTATARRDQA